jgi:hypothetical protein
MSASLACSGGHRYALAAEGTPEDAARWGATALVALFLATLPLVTAGISLAVQFRSRESSG